MFTSWSETPEKTLAISLCYLGSIYLAVTIPGIGPVTAKKLLDMANQTLEESLSDAAESVVGEE